MAAIGSFSDGQGVHRLALTDRDVEARRLLQQWFQELGLKTECDGAGNMYGILGDLDGSPPLVLGSHLDTVAYGGRFDGSLGVIAALEVVQSLLEVGADLNRPLAIANFTNEEGVRFTPDMMGSMYASGQCSVEDVRTAVALDNQETMGSELDKSGYSGKFRLPTPYAFLELHIEQGPALEKSNTEIGIVTGVTGIVWKKVTIKGQSNHAGTTPISLRQDAGLASAELISYARLLAIETNGAITVGRIEFEPNVTNIIPGKVTLTLDIRNVDGSELKEAVNRIQFYMADLEKKHGVKISQETLVDVAPVQFDKKVIEAFEHGAVSCRLSYDKMPSGAGHDAQLMAGCCPSGMIFIPSRDGISHDKLEYSSPEQVINGANTLLNATLSLL